MSSFHEKESVEARAQGALDVVLNQTYQNARRAHTETQVPVSVARQTPLLTPTTGRSHARALFITTDVSILSQTTKSLDGFLNISDVFDEVYIMVLRTGIPAKYPVLRVATNVWLYTVSGKHAWHTPWLAWRMILREFVFAEGFRPDVIIARDPYESALVAMMASRHFDRPCQVQVPAERLPLYVNRPYWQKWLRRWLVPLFSSIRTDTTEQLETLRNKNPHADIDIIPKFRSYTAQLDGTRTLFLREKYPQFNYIILYVGELQIGSSIFNALDAVRNVLRNQRVGFVIVGDGPVLHDCQKRVALLGITEQVIFERSVETLVDYFCSADTLLVTDVNSDADDVVLYGAAAGLPMVMTDTHIRQDLFVDGRDVVLCRPGDVTALDKGLSRLLNNPVDRTVYGRNVRRIAEVRLHSDPTTYVQAYQESIERAIVVYTEA